MTNEEKMFELMTQMYAEIQKGFKQVNERIDKVEGRINKVEDEVKDIKQTVLKIEHDHGQKLEALFDGYKQNAEQLTRIEEEVKKHDEFILRRIK